MTKTGNAKYIYIGFGIVLGLLIAYIFYSYLETKGLKDRLETQKIEIDSLKQNLSTINQKYDDTVKLLEQKKKENIKTAEITIEEPEESNVSTEDESWNNALQSNTFASYLKFISSDTNKGAYNNEAINKLSNLGTSGWLYAGRTTNKNDYSEDQIAQVIWRKNSADNLVNSVPKIGDLVTLKSTMGRRTYPNFLPRDNQNGIWQKEQTAYVQEVKIEGSTAIIVKIIYN